jgi:hypothetical protein
LLERLAASVYEADTMPTGFRRFVMGFLYAVWGYVNQRKKFWLTPLVLVVVLFGALIVVTKGSSIASFKYTLF